MTERSGYVKKDLLAALRHGEELTLVYESEILGITE